MGIAIAVVGASGRTGENVCRALSESADCRLIAAVVSPESARRGQAVPAVTTVAFSSDLSAAVETADAVIDFSSTSSSVEAARLCAELKKPILVATTGHSPEQFAQLQKYAAATPLCVAGNTSIGIPAVCEAAVVAQKILGDSFEIEILEMHHRAKKDAPSGTAKMIAQAIADPRDLQVALRTQTAGIRGEREVGISWMRAGDIIGEHQIIFAGQDERITITHSARDRMLFARGAVHLIKLLLQRKIPGLYSVRDLLLS